MNEWLQKVKNAKRVALFTHILPDGDAIGSTFAMGCILQKLGIAAEIYINETIPLRLQFLAEESGIDYLTAPKDEVYDVCMSLDCGDEGRLGIYQALYNKGRTTVNIDHHVSNTRFGQYQLVDSDACSTGEIVYRLAKEVKLPVDETVATLLYAAIASDTGCFLFTNTDETAHLCAAELLARGARIAKVNKLLFNTNELSALKMQAFAITHLQFFCENKIAVVLITDADLEKLHVTSEAAEGLADIPRSVRGVEVGMVIREWKGKSKASVRTNAYVDASAFASTFGGGGHARAAGFTCDLSLEETKKEAVRRLEELV